MDSNRALVIGRRFALPALAIVFVGLLALAAGYFSESSGRSPPASETTPPTGAANVRGLVQAVTSDRLTLTTGDGVVELQLTPSTSIEALQRPASFAALTPGDWLNVGASPHQQTLLVITGLIVIPQTQLQARP
jgi:hypothetical protein